jgi:hypothetical protein
MVYMHGKQSTVTSCIYGSTRRCTASRDCQIFTKMWSSKCSATSRLRLGSIKRSDAYFRYGGSCRCVSIVRGQVLTTCCARHATISLIFQAYPQCVWITLPLGVCLLKRLDLASFLVGARCQHPVRIVCSYLVSFQYLLSRSNQAQT